MKALDLEQMEQLEGGSCFVAAGLAVATGFFIAGGPATWWMAAGAAAAGAAHGQNVYNECFK